MDGCCCAELNGCCCAELNDVVGVGRVGKAGKAGRAGRAGKAGRVGRAKKAGKAGKAGKTGVVVRDVVGVASMVEPDSSIITPSSSSIRLGIPSNTI